MKSKRPVVIFIFIFLVLGVAGRIGLSLTLESFSVNPEFIQTQIKGIEENKGIEKEAKEQQLKQLNTALDFLKQAREWEQKFQEQDKLSKSAPDQIQVLKTSVASPLTPESDSIPKEESLEKLEIRLLSLQSELAQNTKISEDMEGILKNVSERRTSLPQTITERKKKIEDTRTELKSLSPAPGSGISFDGLLLNARCRASENELKSLEKELQSLDNLQELARLKKEKSEKLIPSLEKKIKLVTERISEIKKIEALESERKAEEELKKTASSYPAALQLARENAALAAQRTGEDGLINRIEKIQIKIDDSKKLLKKLVEEYSSIQLRVKASGLTHAIGMLLRLRKNDLPGQKDILNQLKENRERISDVQIKLLEHEEIREGLIQSETIVADMLKGIDASTPAHKKDLIEKNIRDLLLRKKEFIEANIKDSNTWFSRLVDYDTVQRQLLDQALLYRRYIDEKVLWIKSMPSFWTKQLKALPSGIAWIFKWQNWKKLFAGLMSGFKKNVFVSLLLLVLIVVLHYYRKRLKTRYFLISSKVRKASSDKLIYTFESFADLAFISAAWPFVIFSFAFLLGSIDKLDPFSRSIAESLHALVSVWFTTELLFHLFQKNAMAHNQFRWFPEITHQELEKFIRKILVTALPIYFLMSVMYNSANELFAESAGRILFVILLIVSNVIFHQSFKPNGSVFSTLKNYVSSKWLYSLRVPFYSFFMVFFPILIVLSLIGYNYTSGQLFAKMLTTLILFTAVGIAYSISNRIITVFKRSLALKKRQAKSVKHPVKDEAGQVVVEEEKLEIAVIGEQTRKILKVLVILLAVISIWLIWNDIFPALKIFDQITLWKTRVQVTEIISSPDGSSRETLTDSLVNITLFNVLTAIMIIAVTVLVSKNFSGLLEVVLLSHLPMDQGIKFAIKTITTYILTAIGIIAAFNAIGIGWAKVQWLIAAVSVGLGFGLQEIFANFVSGLIILFERPMRIGDTVTIGDVTGTVSKIKIRGTTVTNRDRKEVIIPNKAFITGQLMNWTLSDTVLRLVFKVGVAYGSDVEKVHKILLDIAESCPEILKDPLPRALFIGFGDSSLDFELRVFISDMSKFATLSDHVNTTIDAEFRKHDIEIPFPQRDIHIRTLPEKIKALNAAEAIIQAG